MLSAGEDTGARMPHRGEVALYPIVGISEEETNWNGVIQTGVYLLLTATTLFELFSKDFTLWKYFCLNGIFPRAR